MADGDWSLRSRVTRYKIIIEVVKLTVMSITGIAAEEVLYACEENESNCIVSSEVGLANPAVHFFR